MNLPSVLDKQINGEENIKAKCPTTTHLSSHPSICFLGKNFSSNYHSSKSIYPTKISLNTFTLTVRSETGKNMYLLLNFSGCFSLIIWNLCAIDASCNEKERGHTTQKNNWKQPCKCSGQASSSTQNFRFRSCKLCPLHPLKWSPEAGLSYHLILRLDCPDDRTVVYIFCHRVRGERYGSFPHMPNLTV